ncbi:hypothetical protein BK764_00325 [Bacillus thuringiensis serovar israelensis]|uniref:Phage tail protein n=2 Tax=Bacillus thuringiensis TaxID=1428 RepID=A0A9Q5SND3_BACTU|nr:MULTISPECIES: hypothetical protein [Bacillus cereus group]EEM58647.1 hypothetical protein bthur0007_34500 [Bacillus thuringiensis serovar monterrey BGSC 4AJ1]MEB9670951.1 hypothetical protein [Bacillus anthracis]OTW45016.1 hypothetical protein BK699_28145 [Bacillus thuringiensis serovar mexicanensis]OTW73638.1 hypothetical protein BK707_02150 [Bacillus thuringiensis serovar coreanensis]OTX01647.1 hypothetical protein BK705_18705 [Bacillus thuringiensis serovar monterrey]
MAAPQPKPENVLFGDWGAFFFNYGETDELPVGATQGGGSFKYEPEFKEIEYDGSPGDTMGMKRITKSKTQISFKTLEFLDKDKIKNFIAGLKVSEETVTKDGKTIKYDVIEATERLTKDSYLKNVAWVGETLGGDIVEIIVYNALSDGSLELGFENESEVVPEVIFTGHRDPENIRKVPWKKRILTATEAAKLIPAD